MKRALFGADEASAARNLAVEWRLDPASARGIDAPASAAGFLGRWSLRGLAVAAVIEAAVVLGAAYGLWAHAGHMVAHFARAGHVETGRDGSGVDGTVDPAQCAPGASASNSHD